MNLDNLSERDRRIIEKNERQKQDAVIVSGLLKKNHTVKEIAKMMGTIELEIKVIIKRSNLNAK